MKSFFGLLKKDFKIAYRNYFFLIIAIVAGILIVVTNFFIPKKASIDSNIIYMMEEENIGSLNKLNNYFSKTQGSRRVNCRDEVIDIMRKDKNSIGIILKETQGKINAELIMQGYESEQSKRAIALSLESLLQEKHTVNYNIENVVLGSKEGLKDISFNKAMVPIMILNESVMLAFILIVALIFMEKEEETTKSYGVSPGGIGIYLFSKISLMAFLSIISTIIITIFTVGFKVMWIPLFITIIVSSIFSSTLAMLIGSFFDNISKAMIWILGISLFLTAPIVSYFMPSFSPTFVTLIPTYDMMFAIRETVFTTGNSTIIYTNTIKLVVIDIILYLLSLIYYKRNLLMK
ncbi:hypothetical protein BD780_001351 [Clostridium tetanomorphum]|uniref:ABC transporter permease n=1 Tax=Clostridium tetanomorphum TaxID=1553 RepID=A0A923EAF2_CLOTT|nr:ABC transporter permease [Clostridium tetanomorphum]KAJ49283.1 hypothetical protein CTM_24019 [Clostridium tetanomorphum DSM 665]KAJ53927.1 hypothetical protein CTM_00155 [Clostridium tetanomorphum DSM 665]MBC2398089.1 ABC transporter permease [Clostridium tetanomorphum]MBP1864656.1 hypothetical protein [Clostridium tetanomorphum]NRS84126.1 hypothetical protein [Clostridium tetanomorphum]